MTTWHEKIFYSLSSVALAAAFFVMSPSQNSVVTDFQNQAKQQFATATVQVFGDQPVFDAPLLVIQSVNQFYQASADEMLALLKPSYGQDDEVIYVAESVYNDFKLAFSPKSATNINLGLFSPAKPDSLQTAVNDAKPTVLGSETSEVQQQTEPDLQIPKNFMQEEALHNIVPEKPAAAPSKPSADALWVNTTDGVTGQVYCVGIFNSEVNRYMGECKNDYK